MHHVNLCIHLKNQFLTVDIRGFPSKIVIFFLKAEFLKSKTRVKFTIIILISDIQWVLFPQRRISLWQIKCVPHHFAGNCNYCFVLILSEFFYLTQYFIPKYCNFYVYLQYLKKQADSGAFFLLGIVKYFLPVLKTFNQYQLKLKMLQIRLRAILARCMNIKEFIFQEYQVTIGFLQETLKCL